MRPLTEPVREPNEIGASTTDTTRRTTPELPTGVAMMVYDTNGAPPLAPSVHCTCAPPLFAPDQIGITAEGTPAGTPSAVADSGLVPAMLFARTENRYVSPMVRSATFRLVPSVVIESTRISG